MELTGRTSFKWLILGSAPGGLACSGHSHKVWISIHDEEISVHWVVF